MAYIKGVAPDQAPVMVRIGYFFTRRHMAKLTGRQPDGMMAPLKMYAHIPGLFRAYGGLEQATAKLHHLEKRYKALAELKSATVTRCEYCIDIGSQISRQWGLSDEELLALPNYRTSNLFNEVDKLVLDYADGLSRTPAEVSEDLVDQLRQHFDTPQLVELAYIVALGNLRARFNVGLGIESAGFSEGMVCALPER